MTDKEMAYPPGLSPHGNSWRITKRIPTELLPHYNGRTLLRHNTGKADKREAASVAWQWLGEQEAEFDRLRNTGRREKTSVAPADIQWLTDSMLSYALGAHEEALKSGTAPAGRKSREAIATMQEFTSWALSEGDFTGVAPVADAWLHENGYDLDEDSEERRHVLLAFSKGLSEALRSLESRHNGRWVETPPAPGRWWLTWRESARRGAVPALTKNTGQDLAFAVELAGAWLPLWSGAICFVNPLS